MLRTEDVRISVRLGSGRTRVWLTLHEAPEAGPGVRLLGLTFDGHAAEDPVLSALLSLLGKEATRTLELGGSVEDLVDRWLMVSFAPRGRVVDDLGSSYYAVSVLDWAAREIGARYCGRPELVGRG